ncbi:hypothetical protein [Oleiagrimonas sp. MCCC 1A03011]|uniref:hypothetical protein n=1 Tax=Oleiagrimonas sp. MCCC 1A03011 TaxID=1926883 RepID=UPI000DC38FF5|nr:hypothetical protein [Oleiagrimonas sp. MCCC 1A03011]RAP59717.1 hypothetical protein BTJ49_03535 [Oleiagrimonas sp. MCCC 1A03011]
MTQRIVYKIICQDGVWSVSQGDEFVGAFMLCESAVKFAGLVAQRNYESDGRPAAVCLDDGEQTVDIILHGERDPAAQALAWLRRVSALRKGRESGARNDMHLSRSA